MDRRIIDYFKENREKYPKDDLVDQLKKSGYPDNEISRAADYVYGDVDNQTMENPTFSGVSGKNNLKQRQGIGKQPQNSERYDQVKSMQENLAKSHQKQQAELRYAGFWIRFLAVIIDGIIVNVMYVAVAIPLFMGAGLSFSGNENDSVAGIIGLTQYPIMWGYYIFMTNRYQATLGKKVLGLVVLSDGGQRASLGKIITRETIGKIVSAITLGIGYIMVGFTKKKQGLHDMISNTVVVRKDANS